MSINPFGTKKVLLFQRRKNINIMALHNIGNFGRHLDFLSLFSDVAGMAVFFSSHLIIFLHLQYYLILKKP